MKRRTRLRPARGEVRARPVTETPTTVVHPWLMEEPRTSVASLPDRVAERAGHTTLGGQQPQTTDQLNEWLVDTSRVGTPTPPRSRGAGSAPPIAPAPANGGIGWAAPLPAPPPGLIHRARLPLLCSRVIESLEGIRVPTLIIVGANDTPFLNGSEYMAKKIPGARHVVIPNAGHAANLDQPDAFNEAVLSFLKDVVRE